MKIIFKCGNWYLTKHWIISKDHMYIDIKRVRTIYGTYLVKKDVHIKYSLFSWPKLEGFEEILSIARWRIKNNII